MSIQLAPSSAGFLAAPLSALSELWAEIGASPVSETDSSSLGGDSAGAGCGRCSFLGSTAALRSAFVSPFGSSACSFLGSTAALGSAFVSPSPFGSSAGAGCSVLGSTVALGAAFVSPFGTVAFGSEAASLSRLGGEGSAALPATSAGSGSKPKTWEVSSDSLWALGSSVRSILMTGTSKSEAFRSMRRISGSSSFSSFFVSNVDGDLLFHPIIHSDPGAKVMDATEGSSA
mmetsp:Transcript_62606/g.149315  ORF Transcript_62606/g.149315 Transcript_62606/m.149315 type:complete len:231 (+) Transcript_62606:1812-2504(+)